MPGSCQSLQVFCNRRFQELQDLIQPQGKKKGWLFGLHQRPVRPSTKVRQEDRELTDMRCQWPVLRQPNDSTMPRRQRFQEAPNKPQVFYPATPLVSTEEQRQAEASMLRGHKAGTAAQHFSSSFLSLSLFRRCPGRMPDAGISHKSLLNNDLPSPPL